MSPRSLLGFKNILKITFGLLFVFHGLIFSFIAVHTTRLTQAAQQWPQASGVIEKLKYSGDFSYTIKYSYEVGGREYIGNRIIPQFAWWQAMSWKDGGLEGILVDAEGKSHFPRYVEGEKIAVFYNPTNPREAFLLPFAPNMRPFKYYGIFFPIILFIFALIGYKKLKHKRNK
jgi:hypothetical protein